MFTGTVVYSWDTDEEVVTATLDCSTVFPKLEMYSMGKTTKFLGRLKENKRINRIIIQCIID